MARKRGKRKLKPSYAIIGDGFTEKIYFDDLKRWEQIENVRIKPELPADEGDFKGTLEKADQLIVDGVDKVYAIIDIDDIVTKRLFEKYKNEIKKRSDDIKEGKLIIIVCNPCFEIWFLLHYKYSTKQYRRCSGLEADLRNHIDGYSKNREYLKKAKIYSTLRPLLFEKAIPNSKKLLASQSSATGDRYPNCMVHKIILDLGIN